MRKHRPSRSQSRRAERRIKKALATGRKVLGLDIQQAKDRYPRDSKRILEARIRDKNMELPSYAWPGGYPMFYVTKRDEVACPDCANEIGGDAWNEGIQDGDANWEDPDLYCDSCSKRIESAYAEDRDDNGEDE